MSMKKTIIALAALAIMAWGCSSDNDSSPAPQPPTPSTPTEIPAGTDVRPTWQAPNYDLYDQTMTVEVLLQDTLLPYATANDLMAVMADSEVRGISTPVPYEGQWIFPFIVASNNGGEPLSLSYYCDKLHRIFTIEWTRFDATVPPMGEDGIYKPIFIK